MPPRDCVLNFGLHHHRRLICWRNLFEALVSFEDSILAVGDSLHHRQRHRHMSPAGIPPSVFPADSYLVAYLHHGRPYRLGLQPLYDIDVQLFTQRPQQPEDDHTLLPDRTATTNLKLTCTHGVRLRQLTDTSAE